MENIYSEFGTTLAISLRQSDGSDLSFVTLSEIEGATEVLIDALTEPLAPGEYMLVLESYNSLSGGKRTLVVDTIIISVVDQCS